MEQALRLGQKVYGVAQNGTIVPTLINELHLPEEGVHHSELQKRSEERLKGKAQKSAPFGFRTLCREFGEVYLTFDEAYEVARRKLEVLKASETISVRDQRAFVKKYAEIIAGKDALRTTVDAVTTFTASKNAILRVITNDDTVRSYQQSDVPQHYFEPGTSVWVADPKRWRLIKGTVSEVSFAPSWKRKLIYCCGSHTNLDATHVFRTKRGALNFLEREFAEKLPGTLDRMRVPVVPEVSKAEEHEQRIAQFRELAKRPDLEAREPAE